MAKVSVADYTFPASSVELDKIMAKVDSIVNLLNEAEVIKEDIGVVAEDAEDKLGIPKALVNKLAKAKFEAAKFAKNLEQLNEIDAVLNFQAQKNFPNT